MKTLIQDDIIYGYNKPKNQMQYSKIDSVGHTFPHGEVLGSGWLDSVGKIVEKGLPIFEKGIPVLGKLFSSSPKKDNFDKWNEQILTLYNQESDPKLKAEILKQLKK